MGYNPHVKGFRLVQVARNDVNVGTGELLQLSGRLRVTDDGKDVVLWVADLRTVGSTSVR